jgi:hypothetical protein
MKIKIPLILEVETTSRLANVVGKLDRVLEHSTAVEAIETGLCEAGINLNYCRLTVNSLPNVPGTR